MVRAVRLLAVVALLSPGVASALVHIEGFYGIERPPSTSFHEAVSGATSSPDLFKSSLQMAGGDLLLDLGGLELGAIIDTTFRNHTASQTAFGALGGFALATRFAKLDLLAEAGGHRYGNFLSNPEIITASSTDQWFFYVGLRPGITVKLGGGPLSLGVWGFVRWDVTTQNLPVTVGSAGSAGSYKLGGTTIGATLRLGFEL
jgi:hypothetical protein